MIRRLLLALLLLALPAVAQTTGVDWVNPVGTTSLSLGVTLTGSGTGTMCDTVTCTGGQIDCIWNGTTQSGTCGGSYSVGFPITLTVTVTGGSTFNWAGVGGSPGCSGNSLSCSFFLNLNSTVTGNFTGSGSGAVPADYMALDFNQLQPPGPATNILNYGFGRGWDLVNVLWPGVQTKACSPSPCLGGANNAFTFTGVNSLLAAMHTNGVDEFDAPLSRVPTFASSNPTDSSCNGGPGQCDIPSDINTNGTGTNQFFRDWVAAYGAHINGLDDTNCPSGPTCYTKTHAALVAVENANEPDICKFFSYVGCSNGNALGSFDVLARWQWDMYFVYKGDALLTFACTAVATSGVYTCALPAGGASGAANYYQGQHVNVTGFAASSGQNNVTNGIIGASSGTSPALSLTICAPHALPAVIPCTGRTTVAETHAGTTRLVNPYTGETAAQTIAAVNSIALGGPINTSTIIAGPSYHAPSNVVAYQTAFLYCTGARAVTSGAGTNCVGPGANVVTDYINEHTKPGGCYAGGALWLTSASACSMDTWTASIQGAITAAVDLAKPVFGSEGGFGASAYCTVGTVTSGCAGPYADTPLNQAAYVAKFYIYTLIKGQTWNVWYDWHSNSIGTGGNQANAAYNLAATALVGSTGLSCFHGTNGVSDTLNPSPGSLYKCPLTLATSKAALWVWDDDNTGGTAAGKYFDSSPAAPNNLECSPISSTCPTHTQSVTTAWNQLHWFSAVDGISHTACGSTTCSYAVGTIPILIENQ